MSRGLFRSLLRSSLDGAVADFYLYFFTHVDYFLYKVFKKIPKRQLFLVRLALSIFHEIF